jgi:sugar lactone lactonase YvrE
VLVSDIGNSRVQLFNLGGVFLDAWGEAGAGPGQFSAPRGMVATSSGTLYVADQANSRVQIFSLADHSYRGKIDGDSRGRFSVGGADGLAVHPVSGNIIVVDYIANLVKIFQDNGTFVTEFGDIALAPQIALHNPNDVAVGPNELLYVADGSNHRIVVFNTLGVQQDTWGTLGTGNGQFNFPTAVGIDPAGNVYVVDANNARVQKFSADGQFLSKWGTPGSENGQFIDPIGIRVTENRVFVVDTGNARVQYFDLNGVYFGQFGSAGSGDGQFNLAWRITTDSTDYIYVTEFGNYRVQKFRPSGAYLSQFGTAGAADGQFDLVSGIGIDPSGAVVVSDAGNARIQIFQGAAGP